MIESSCIIFTKEEYAKRSSNTSIDTSVLTHDIVIVLDGDDDGEIVKNRYGKRGLIEFY